MNNWILAVLELKGVITNDEAQKLAAGFANGTQSAYYKDALHDIKQLLPDSKSPTKSSFGGLTSTLKPSAKNNTDSTDKK